MKKKKQEPRNVLEYFEKDSAKVRLFALLIDRLTVPRLGVALVGLLWAVLKFFA